MSYSRTFLLPYFLAVLGGILAESPMNVQPLTDIIVPITGDQVITRLCEVRAANLFWMVNNMLVHFETWTYLKGIGFTFPNHGQNPINGTLTESVKIDISPKYQNNNSVLYCIGHNNNEQVNSSGTLIIAEHSVNIPTLDQPPRLRTWTNPYVPLRPNLVASTLGKNSFHIRWDAPYSWRDFPITNYTLTIELPSGKSRSVVFSPDTLSHNATLKYSTTSCANVNFSIYATSEVGRSDSKSTSVALPAAPGIFVELPKTKVTFNRQGFPQVDISFIFPFVCPYNLAAYLLRIKDKEGRLVHFDGPHVISWNASGTQVAINVSGSELTRNARYSAELSVSTLGGHASVTFDIALGAATSTLNSLLGAIVGGICALLVLATIALVMAVLCWRRKLKSKPKAHFGNAPKKSTMIVNPIYEEISCLQHLQTPMLQPASERDEGYTSKGSTPIPFISPCRKTDGHEGNNKDHSSEDGYMTMNSIGTIIAQLSGSGMDMTADRNSRCHENQYR